MAVTGVRANKNRIRRRAKKHSGDDRVEELEKEVRELKSLNRSLMKQLKKLSKGINRLEFEEALERLEDEQEEKKHRKKNNEGENHNVRTCPECASKGIKEIVVAGRRFERCDICGYKSGKL